MSIKVFTSPTWGGGVQLNKSNQDHSASGIGIREKMLMYWSMDEYVHPNIPAKVGTPLRAVNSRPMSLVTGVMNNAININNGPAYFNDEYGASVQLLPAEVYNDRQYSMGCWVKVNNGSENGSFIMMVRCGCY